MDESGISIVEILIVIVIIAIVSTLVSLNFISVKPKAEKSKMQADIDAIAKAYETHFDPITQLYRPLRVGDFTNPGLLTSSNYSGFLTSQSSTFQVCANLEGKGASCTSSGPNCYCRKSSQSMASAPKKITATSSLTPSPTSSPTSYSTPTTYPAPATPTQPAGGGTYQVKVWLIAYYPTGNFYNAVGGDPAAYTKNILLPAMNEASKYHGYKNPQATPALNYTITDDNIVVENNPHTYISGEAGYQEIFTKYNLCTLAKQKDIKAMIVWGDGSTTSGYSGVQWESAITGNKGILTNGGVYPQLCPDKTIVIYSLNYTRGLAEALESYGHHLERVFGQFRTEYFGWADRDSCGNDHNPPNSRFEYDRSNTDPFQSDCRNWKPDGTGQRETLNCNIWACDGAPWLKWWMQNMPGIGNTLVGVSGVRIPNWWVYIGDPDNCYNNALGCSGL